MPQNTILIKTFVLGANHGQYLQALGLLHLTKQLTDNCRIVHSRYNNHALKEIVIHLRSLTLVKYIDFCSLGANDLILSRKCLNHQLLFMAQI